MDPSCRSQDADDGDDDEEFDEGEGFLFHINNLQGLMMSDNRKVPHKLLISIDRIRNSIFLNITR